MNTLLQLSTALRDLEKTPVELASDSAVRNCQLGQYRQARLDALRAISLDPEYVPAYVSLSIALFHLRSFKTSVEVLTPFMTHPLAQQQFESATTAYKETQTGEYKLVQMMRESVKSKISFTEIS
jgi:tetratricopeptide (TPR) repeat protein